MSQTQARPGRRILRLTLDSDGKGHPLIDATAAYTVLAGLTAFILGMINTASMAGSILGVTGLLAGLAGQMMSVTRAERVLLVFGIVASFVGMGLAFAHGGFS